MIFVSASLKLDLARGLPGPGSERIVLPASARGRARYPRASGAYWDVSHEINEDYRLTGISPTPVKSQNLFISRSSSRYKRL